MRHELKITGDGSPTLYVPELDEHYHSIHGAVQESMHVFIQNGLMDQMHLNHSDLRILEIGLGTGLNVLLTLRESLQKKFHVNYHALEPFPLEQDVVNRISFDLPDFTNSDRYFQMIHSCSSEKNIQLTDHFIFKKSPVRLEDAELKDEYDLVYFDAFGPRVQPEIWSDENFKKIFSAMSSNGTLVTYCSKGSVRRSMHGAGFQVEKLPGPPGKREMLRAKKVT